MKIMILAIIYGVIGTFILLPLIFTYLLCAKLNWKEIKKMYCLLFKTKDE